MSRTLLPILLSCIVAATVTGCAFSRVTFDNKFTHVKKPFGREQRSERDVSVQANFVTHDSAVLNVQRTTGLTFAGAAQVVKLQGDIEEKEAKEVDLEAQLIDLKSQRNQVEALHIGPRRYIGILQGIWVWGPCDEPDFIVPDPGCANDGGSDGAIKMESKLTTLRSEAVAWYKENELEKHADAYTKLVDAIQALSEWDAAKVKVAEVTAEEGEGYDEATAIAISALGEKVNELVAKSPLSDDSDDSITVELNDKISGIEDKIGNTRMAIVKLDDLLAKLLPADADRAEVLKAIQEGIQSGAAAAPGVPSPEHGALVNLAKEKLDEKKEALENAKDDLKTIQGLDMPALAKNAAERAQKQLLHEVQGEYNEAYNEFAAVISDVTAQTNYSGPGERSVINSFRLFVPPSTIDRYPNGMVKRIGIPPHTKGIAIRFTEEMWHTIRVLGIPAAYVIGAHQLAQQI